MNQKMKNKEHKAAAINPLVTFAWYNKYEFSSSISILYLMSNGRKLEMLDLAKSEIWNLHDNLSSKESSPRPFF